MKRITLIHLSTVLLVAFFVTAGVSAQIDLESNEKGLRVNGEIIDSSDLPESLSNIVLGPHFSLHSGGSFPMWVIINDVQYKVWEDRIVESDRTGNVSFKVRIQREPDSRYLSMEVPFDPDLRGLGRTARTTSQSVDDAAEILWDSSWEPLRVAERLLMERAALTKSQIEAITHATSIAGQDALRPLELSNYMADVLGANDGLSELLRYEWRKEFEARQMAARIRDIAPGRERDIAIAELREKLETIFFLKQDNRVREIRRLGLELEKMQLQVRERNQAMERLIDARLDELLGTGR
ncbi:MAG: hypothetical protein OXD43_01305 [Bacteroidetes bacterium]|nr:hypothetical protein [Bacteroidota bacterium]